MRLPLTENVTLRRVPQAAEDRAPASGFEYSSKLVAKYLRNTRALSSPAGRDDALAFSRSMTLSAMLAYWEAADREAAITWPILSLPSGIELAGLPKSAARLARRIGSDTAALDVGEASYLLGILYTGTMPSELRSGFGAYYTPPALCERLLDLATDAGVDWRSARVLDPACGGGAFLSPVARRMAESLKGCSAKIALNNIVQRLRGLDLDPFAAWMSQVFLEKTLGALCTSANMRLPSMVKVCNSLEHEPEGDSFDLVVGNPPYGRVTLSPSLRRKFHRSLYGHANLYAVFTDLALSFTRSGGVIAYVTPTSFLSGRYFKALRSLLGREAPPAIINFITERKGIFSDVLQETMLAIYRRGGTPDVGQVHFISPTTDGGITSTSAGSFSLPENPDASWVVPRAKAHSSLVRRAGRMAHRLIDYGYKVSTGPLVWNRHKASLRDDAGTGRYPLIWAEAVRPDGAFEFRARKRNHKPYFEPLPEERWVVTGFPCVLLQRTTAKEQARRLIAAELPAAFIREHGAVVIENHLNMIRPINGAPLVSPAALAALLNTEVVDQVFRCINGSVAVSAYELESLPLPPADSMIEIECLVGQGARRIIEQTAKRLYGRSAS
jgi:adenine-specific DNA-methyltransferase